VTDAANGILDAAERYDEGDPVNLGSGMEISIRDLAELIAKHAGYDGPIEWDTSQPNGQPRRMLDVSRARERFGWEACVDFDEGVRRTVEWWEASRSLENP
jgi:dTDP-glucose 4,6-dehydratase/GDP-L-fucose synthase